MPLGTYRRRILITTAPGCARADIEDDPHRYGVTIFHDGRTVTGIKGDAIRTPWSLCVEAAGVLDRLIGMPLSADPIANYEYTDGKHQCTHIFDIAGYAIAHAFRGTLRRQYDIEAPFATLDFTTPRTLTLHRDGQLLWTWSVQGDLISAPQPFAGHSLRNLIDWARTAFPDPDDFESVVVLRRAVRISGARTVDLDQKVSAAIGAGSFGGCYVYWPGIVEKAWRVVGATRDFSNAPDKLLSDPEPVPASDLVGPQGPKRY